MNTRNKKLILILSPVASIVISMVIGGMFITAIGQDPFAVYVQLFEQTLGNSY